MKTDESLILKIVNEIPEIGKIYKEHVSAYDQLLPHVIMGDIARFAVIV